MLMKTTGYIFCLPKNHISLIKLFLEESYKIILYGSILNAKILSVPLQFFLGKTKSNTGKAPCAISFTDAHPVSWLHVL